jgi:hypothetical protein
MELKNFQRSTGEYIGVRSKMQAFLGICMVLRLPPIVTPSDGTDGTVAGSGNGGGGRHRGAGSAAADIRVESVDKVGGLSAGYPCL